MPYKRDYIIIEEKDGGKSGLNWFFYAIFGVMVFLAIYFPFFAPNLRYSVGSLFSQIFSVVGTFCVFFGVLFMVFGILSIFLRRPYKGIQLLCLGFILIYLAGYFIIPGIMGSRTGGKGVPKGYH